ncbi:hypothetical protein ANOM_000650, partial [Aspergillus nomiae NRRL 13137]
LLIMPQDLRGSAIEAFWTGTSFLLNKTASQHTFWSLSETFGRKHLAILSPGSAGGGIISLAKNIIADLVPLHERGTSFGFQSAVWTTGSVTDPVIDGDFVEAASWT